MATNYSLDTSQEGWSVQANSSLQHYPQQGPVSLSMVEVSTLISFSNDFFNIILLLKNNYPIWCFLQLYITPIHLYNHILNALIASHIFYSLSISITNHFLNFHLQCCSYVESAWSQCGDLHCATWIKQQVWITTHG